MDTGTDKIHAGVFGAVGWIVFNSPDKHNAISLSMSEGAYRALRAFEEDDAVRVIALRGNGGKAFVSGADISEFAEKRSNAEAAAEYEKASGNFFEGVRNCPKPTVAMIQGYCMGGGLGLACACDLRISDETSIFAIPAGRLGIGYRPNMTRWVSEAVGSANTKEILFTARRYNAEEALAMGLVNKVVPSDEIASYVEEYVNGIADNAPLSVRASKFIVNEVAKSPSDWDVDTAEEMVKACANSADYAEGRTAFMEKRRPEFKGK